MEGIKLKGVYTLTCSDKGGNIKWKEVIDNRVVNDSLDFLLDFLFSGPVTAVDNWYIGLMSGSPNVVAGDTMASHSGWTEVTDYTEGTRQEFVSTKAGLSVNNTASVAVFNINDTVTVGGAFLVSNATKGGSDGRLLSGSAFTNGNRSAQDGDVINVTYTFNVADAGT